MIINKLTLHRYKRLFLGEIETLVLTPENKLSLILGKNGIGKSSLLQQLTPLPGNLSKDFKDGGYKIIDITHNEDSYILTSGVDGGKKHSFLKNDKEFNLGGTLRVQQELVKEYFNITPHVNNVLLGINKFTIMSPNERKKWITEISNVDYTYAISTFNTLKQRHRDITGGIKLLTNNIAKIELDVLEDDAIVKLNNDIDHLSDFIEYLLTLVEHTTDNISNIDSMLNKTNNYNNKILELIANNDNIKTIDVNTIVSKISIIETDIDRTVKDIAKINKELIDIDNSKLYTDNNAKLIELKETLTKKVNSKNTLNISSDVVDMINVPNSYRDISTMLTSVVSDLTAYDDIDVSKDVYNDYVSKLEHILKILNKYENRLSVIETTLNNYDKLLTDDNMIKCSDCGNTWHHKYKHDDVSELNKELIIVKTKISEYSNHKVKYTKIVTRLSEKSELVTKFKNIVYDNKQLTPIWDYLLKDVIINKENTPMYNKLNIVLMELSTWEEIIVAYNKLTKVTDKLKEIEVYKDIATKLSDASKDKLLLELEELTDKRYNFIKEKDKFNKLLDVKKTYDKTVEELKSTLKEWYSTKKIASTKIRNKHLKDLISKLKEIMIDLTNSINNNNTVKNRVSKDKKLLDSYKTKEKVLKLAIRELSPSEGLIAKSINSFLNVFLEDINTLINTIWSYDMKILPCEISDGNDLDYKFKVLVNNEEVIEDISKTSSGMQEIIDLVFRIMFMKYMGLHNTPLMLDEFGKTFDAEHRITAYNTVDRILMSNFTQVFMVSHFESMYGRFVNADICVLNTDGVELNNVDSFNKTLKMN